MLVALPLQRPYLPQFTPLAVLGFVTETGAEEKLGRLYASEGTVCQPIRSDTICLHGAGRELPALSAPPVSELLVHHLGVFPQVLPTRCHFGFVPFVDANASFNYFEGDSLLAEQGCKGLNMSSSANEDHVPR